MALRSRQRAPSVPIQEHTTQLATFEELRLWVPSRTHAALDAKRALDIVASLVGIVLLLPLLALVSLAIVLDSRGPALSGPDTALIARQADATLLVSRREKLQGRSLGHATAALQNARAAPVAVVLAS